MDKNMLLDLAEKYPEYIHIENEFGIILIKEFENFHEEDKKIIR